MPDIAMCQNGCKSQTTCYRFMATPDIYQTFADFKPKEGEDKCDYYYKMK